MYGADDAQIGESGRRRLAQPDELLDEPRAIRALWPRGSSPNDFRCGAKVGLELIAVLDSKRLKQGHCAGEILRRRIPVDENDVLRRLLRAPDDLGPLAAGDVGAGNKSDARRTDRWLLCRAR